MKTFALIEIDADGEMCGEDCPHLTSAFGKHKWAYCNLEVSDPDADSLESEKGKWKRERTCLAAEAAWKEMDNVIRGRVLVSLWLKVKLDDPVVREMVELSKMGLKLYIQEKDFHIFRGGYLTDNNIIKLLTTLLVLTGEEE